MQKQDQIYDLQKRIRKMFRATKKEVNEIVHISNISADKWKNHFASLQSPNILKGYIVVDIEEVQQITVEEVRSEMKQLKNGKAPGPNNLPNEFLKYEGGKLADQLLN